MRVTNSMMISNMMNNLNKSLSRMNKYQSQLATNKRITKLSDDPVGVIQSLQARINLSKTTQYKTNAEDAKSWLAYTETSLMEINNLIKRAYELTIDAANDTKSISERQAIAVEIDQIKQQYINTLNSSFGGQYIFGGYNVSETPFTTDSDGKILYNGVPLDSVDPEMGKETIYYEVGKGVKLDVSMSGLKVIGTGSNNMLKMFEDLTKSLNEGQYVGNFVDDMKKSQEHILSLVSEVGGRSNRIDFITTRYESDEINYEEIKSRVEDIDQAEVIMQFKMQEAVYRSALAVGARVIQPSLVDFIR